MVEIERVVGRRVREARKAAGLTQSELSELLDVAVETVSRLERGVAIPSLRTLDEVAHALGTNIVHLLDPLDGRTGREEAIAALVAELRLRSERDVRLVHDLASRVFEELPARRRRK